MVFYRYIHVYVADLFYHLLLMKLMKLTIYKSRSDSASSQLARGVELGLALSREHTPVGLVSRGTVVTNALGLPGLVVGLEVEDVHSPGEHAADALLEESLRVFGTGDSLAIVRAAR